MTYLQKSLLFLVLLVFNILTFTSPSYGKKVRNYFLSKNIETQFICPFEGTEILVEIRPLEANSFVSYETFEQLYNILIQRLEKYNLSSIALIPFPEDNQILIQVTHFEHIDILNVILKPAGILEFRIENITQEIDIDPNRLIPEHPDIIENFTPTQLTPNFIEDIYAQPSEFNNGLWEIMIVFDEEGEEIFREITREIAGTQRALGIFFNTQLIAMPTVPIIYKETGIINSEVIITSGIFTQETVEELVLQMQRGLFPASIHSLSIYNTNNNEC